MRYSVIGIFLLLIALFAPKVEAYTQKDCEIFVFPELGSTHYQICIQDPSRYSHMYIYYTVQFYNDGTLMKTETVAKGRDATPPVQPTKVQHTFQGWDKDVRDVQSNLTVNAMWLRTQKVTFLDYNGTVLKEQFVEQGGSATPPNVQARAGFQFSGWSGSYTNVWQDASLIATYEAITYQVVFFYEDLRVYQTMTTSYNGSVTPPAGPVVAGKTFTQWSVSTNQVQSDLSVYPQYDSNRYRVRFMDGSQVLKDQFVDHGQAATPPLMNKEGHIFGGWDSSYTNIQQSIDLNAQWTKQLYDVYFYHPSGDVLSHQSIAYAEAASAPVYSPTPGYEFVSWDKSFDQITATTHVYPVEQIARYAVYFMDNETLLHQETVNYGDACSLFTPVKVGHEFVSWSDSCDAVFESLTLQATFSPIQYTVRFYDFTNFVIKEELVNHGSAATPPNAVFPNYTFLGWNNAFDSVTEDLTVRPLGQMRTYQAVFKNYDGVTLCTRIVAYNAVVECPAPQRVGFTFTGWSDSLTIQDDITLFAQYEPLMFQVDFYVEGVLAKREMVQYNFDATPPQINLQEFDFTRWEGSYQQVTSDMRVDAVLRRREYVVVFKVDGVTIKETTVAHGEDAVPPVSVVKQGHAFTGWEEEYTNVTTHRAIHAVFEPVELSVTFVVQGSPYEVVSVPYMSDVIPPVVEVAGHDLIGWRGTLEAIEEDTSVYAILRPKTYLVTFIEDGEVVSEQQVSHGESATPPHMGPWDQSFVSVTRPLTIQRRAQGSTDDENETGLTGPDLAQSVPTTGARLNTSNTTYRYSFDINLAEYELINVTLGGRPLDDVSLISFQQTNIFRREVRWFEIVNPSHEDIEFQVRNTQTLELFAVDVQESPASGSGLGQQMWLSIVSFFQRFFG